MIPTRSRRLLPALILSAISVSIVLMTGELAVRFSVPSDRWAFRDAAEDWMIGPRLGWVQKPGLDVTTRTEQGWTVRFQTNPDGLTPPTASREKKAGTLRVMFFGDSTVVGRTVPQDQTVHARLEAFLQGKGVSAEVFNAGVQGYSTDQVLLWMEELLPLYQPDIVIYGACDNDFGGNVLRKAFGQAKPVFRLRGDGSLEEIPPDLGTGIRSFDGGMGKWPQHSALYRYFQPAFLAFRAKAGRWEERNLLGIAPEIYYEPGALDRIDWRLFSSLIKEMKKTADQNHAKFFFYTHPALAEVWDPYIRDTEKRLRLLPGQYDRYTLQKRFIKVGEETGTEFIPLIGSFVQRQSEGPFHLLPRDPHSNPRGYDLTAQTLGNRILRER